MNKIYEQNYSKFIEPIYGKRREVNYDKKLEKDVDFHSFTIKDRINMEHIDSYTIDPDGCEDADDAFSIYENANKIYLAIHIADPTEYIPIKSNIWKDIMKRITTKYPSNREPIHMMPKKILELSSLQENSYGSIKNSITILTEISNKTYLPLNNVKLLFTTINVKNSNKYSYKTASINKNKIYDFEIGLKISEALKKKRAKLTTGFKLNELSISYPIYEDNIVYLYQDTNDEKLIKQMIAEFAIFANSFIGAYLKINLNEGIFRTCNANKWLDNIYPDISGEELLKGIIQNGIKADYMANISPHDLVGMPEYCHFTSPIRRLSDCVCHYLLKYIFLKNNGAKKPFTSEELDEISNKCYITTRNDKKNQYLDIKFRLIQVMNNMIIKRKKINISYYISGYTGLFLNIIINKINNFKIHMSYSIMIKNYQNIINPNEIFYLEITKINCFTKYDQGCIPELEKNILSQTIH